MTSRHPVTVHWTEIARVLAPGGTYFAQHVGSGTNVEISEYFLGPLEALHNQIERDGAFRSTMSRTLFEVRKPNDA